MDNMFKKKDNAVVEIIVVYDDGTIKHIEKGAVIRLEPNGEETNLKMEMKNFKQEDLITAIYGFSEMGVRMGLFE